MRYIYCLFALVWIGCGGRQANPPSEPAPVVPVQAPHDSTVDFLRAEVQVLADIVRQSNVIDLPETLRFCGERVPVERWWVRKAVEEAFRFYTGFARNRKRIDLYLRESRFYFPFIEDKLRDESLPEDLKYVPVAESELNLRAQSSRKAVGFWQLMTATGRDRSMHITRYIDERRDFERATEVATKKLKSDHAELRDWFLTLAAYNAGLNRVKQSLADQADSSYFNMVLPPETMDYCYRLIALKYILEFPHRYGFSERPDLTRAIQVVSHVIKEKSTITELARKFGIPGREFQLLNPQFTSTTIPPGTYRLKIPQDSFAVTDSTDSNHVVQDSIRAGSKHH